MKISATIQQSVHYPAWTQRHLDGNNVTIKRIRKFADGCYLVKEEYKK